MRSSQLREEKGYTYGAGAGFDLRRAAGPFSARAAVNTGPRPGAPGDSRSRRRAAAAAEAAWALPKRVST